MSTKRYIVAPDREFNYPADVKSQTLIKQVGGRRNLSDEQKKLVKYKNVIGGQDCSDMPQDIRDIYVERGWILVTEERAKPQTKTVQDAAWDSKAIQDANEEGD